MSSLAQPRLPRPPCAGVVPASAGATDRWGDLMAAAQDGDTVAYRQLLTEVDAWLQRYYARRLPSPMSSDVTQETLLAIHLRRHTYQPGRPFKAWLAAIARYKWIDCLRAARRNPAVPGDEDVTDDIVSPHDHATAVIGASVLHELLSRLKPAQAQAIRLVKLDALTIEEASRRTGQSPSLVKVNIHRGMTRLAAMAS